MGETFKHKNLVLAYYAILVAILATWTSVVSAPPIVFRAAFIVAAFIPVVFIDSSLLSVVMIVFYIVSRIGATTNYFVSTLLPYPIIFLICILLNKSSFSFSRVPKSVLFMALYTLVIDLVTSGSVHEITLCAINFIILLAATSSNSRIVKILEIAFIVASLILSMQFLILGDQFLQVYGTYSDGMERITWTDPNYLGYVIGMGVTVPMVMLFNDDVRSKWFIILLLVAIVVCMTAMFLNASRSALLSTILCFGYIILLSKTKIAYKVVFSVLAVFFVVYLYYNDYLDLILYRMDMGTTDTGGGRFPIWQTKLNAYFEEGNLFSIIFGKGYEGGYNLGFNQGQGFHNEFIAFLAEYGIIGFSILMYLTIKLFIKMWRHNKISVSLVLYFVSMLLTLEPISLGFFPAYLIVIYVISKCNEYYEEGEFVCPN